MLGDYGDVILATENIVGKNVDSHTRRDGMVIEHIFKNVCVVQWPFKFKKITEQTIEFIIDLEIKEN